MPIPDQVRDDVSGVQNMLEWMDSGLRHNDKPWADMDYEYINDV
ncbi:MAG: hypothetical protein QNJ61_08340 [Desulfobacterales bacterium]|nr:hypothetical protein [Desulfobacterales bacterium]